MATFFDLLRGDPATTTAIEDRQSTTSRTVATSILSNYIFEDGGYKHPVQLHLREQVQQERPIEKGSADDNLPAQAMLGGRPGEEGGGFAQFWQL